MHAGIVGEFGVERCSHGSSLPDRNCVRALGGEDFYALSNMLALWGADENHFERRAAGVCRKQPALADGAVDLTSVGIAADADVEGAETLLRGILDVGCEQDCSGAGAESRLGLDELFQLFESSVAQEFEEVSKFDTRNDEAVDGVELFRLINHHDFGS